MQIKTFRFNGCRNVVERNSITGGVTDSHAEWDSPDKIDDFINGWAQKYNKVIVDVKITPVVVCRHNNGGYDTVDLIYTVFYNQEDRKNVYS